MATNADLQEQGGCGCVPRADVFDLSLSLPSDSENDEHDCCNKKQKQCGQENHCFVPASPVFLAASELKPEEAAVLSARPPVSPSDVTQYLSDMLNAMDKDMQNDQQQNEREMKQNKEIPEFPQLVLNCKGKSFILSPRGVSGASEGHAVTNRQYVNEQNDPKRGILRSVGVLMMVRKEDDRDVLPPVQRLSGSVITSHHILTAAHGLISEERLINPEWLYFCPGYDSPKAPGQNHEEMGSPPDLKKDVCFQIVEIVIPKAYGEISKKWHDAHANGNAKDEFAAGLWQHDWAILRVKKDMSAAKNGGFLAIPFGIDHEYYNVQNRNFWTAGYPMQSASEDSKQDVDQDDDKEDSKENDQMKETMGWRYVQSTKDPYKGLIFDESEKMAGVITMGGLAYEGQSGGPVGFGPWKNAEINEKTETKIIGVLVYGDEIDGKPVDGYGVCAIRELQYDLICLIIEMALPYTAHTYCKDPGRALRMPKFKIDDKNWFVTGWHSVYGPHHGVFGISKSNGVTADHNSGPQSGDNKQVVSFGQSSKRIAAYLKSRINPYLYNALNVGSVGTVGRAKEVLQKDLLSVVFGWVTFWSKVDQVNVRYFKGGEVVLDCLALAADDKQILQRQNDLETQPLAPEKTAKSTGLPAIEYANQMELEQFRNKRPGLFMVQLGAITGFENMLKGKEWIELQPIQSHLSILHQHGGSTASRSLYGGHGHGALEGIERLSHADLALILLAVIAMVQVSMCVMRCCSCGFKFSLLFGRMLDNDNVDNQRRRKERRREDVEYACNV